MKDLLSYSLVDFRPSEKFYSQLFENIATDCNDYESKLHDEE
jgi:hypothetical protein